MKRIFLGIIICLAITGAGTRVVLGAEQVNLYDVNIRMNEDASIDVVETISYDFGTELRHGIFRNIPVKYGTEKDGRELKLSEISVRDGNGVDLIFQIERQGNDLQLKIGDPNKFVAGEQDYIIRYKVKGAINYFDEHDELYWNAIGGGWNVPIRVAKVAVSFPREMPTEMIRRACFIGLERSANSCADMQLVQPEGREMADMVIFSQPNLGPQEYLTIVVGVPKGVIHQPTAEELAREAAEERQEKIKMLLIAAGIPLVTLLVMLVVWFRWGRDPKGRGTIITQFDVPDQLTPVEVGTLMDERTDQKDVSASIIYLAIKGYLKIKRIEKKKMFSKGEDYVLQQIGGMSTDVLPDPERCLYTALFYRDEATKHTVDNKAGEVIAEVKVSDLTREFYGDYQEIKKKVTDSLLARGYFDVNPNHIQLYYIVAAIAVAVVGFLLANLVGPAVVIGCVLAGVLILVFSFFMPRKTAQGVLVREHLLGLKDYLKVAEADRIKFHNAPDKNPQLFEKFLPYAMVLGVEKEWAKQFEGIYTQPPGWYSDPNMQSFNALMFMNSLDSFSTSASTSMTTAQSGGSGFSGGGAGGGFGGGGGGSW